MKVLKTETNNYYFVLLFWQPFDTTFRAFWSQHSVSFLSVVMDPNLRYRSPFSHRISAGWFLSDPRGIKVMKGGYKLRFEHKNASFGNLIWWKMVNSKNGFSNWGNFVFPKAEHISELKGFSERKIHPPLRNSKQFRTNSEVKIRSLSTRAFFWCRLSFLRSNLLKNKIYGRDFFFEKQSLGNTT